MTYTLWKGLLALVILCAGAIGSSAQQISIGFIGDQGTFGDHNNAAFEWASNTFNVTLISPADLANEDLTSYAVLWWQEGDADPTSLFTDDVAKALNDYVKKGGALLLSAAAEKLATPLGVESGVPRIYGPGADNQAAGLRIREDTVDHPVWKGFDPEAGVEIQLTPVGYPVSSDYWSRTFVEAVTIGDCWETGSEYGDAVGAFVEWPSGDGLVFGMGWRLPHWTEDNSDRPTLEKLTINLIDYLASESLFSAVDCTRSVVTTWASLKVR
jgi:hypothetical protein